MAFDLDLFSIRRYVYNGLQANGLIFKKEKYMTDNQVKKNLRDRNLLFGVIAVQLHFLKPADLGRASLRWAADQEKSLGAVLVEIGLLDEEQDQAIEQQEESVSTQLFIRGSYRSRLVDVLCFQGRGKERRDDQTGADHD
jgi:hypothetical protein